MSTMDSTLEQQTNHGGLHAAFDSLSIAYFRIDQNGYITDTNPTSLSMLGLTNDTPWPERHYSQNKVFVQAGLSEEIGQLLGQTDVIWKRRIQLHPSPGRITSAQICLWQEQANGQPSDGLQAVILPASPRRSKAAFEHCESQHVQILEEVSTALTSSLELVQILRVILTGATAGQGLGFNRAFLFLADADETVLTGHMAVGPSSPEEAGRIWNGLTARHLTLREALEASASNNNAENRVLTALISDMKIRIDGESIIARCCRSGDWCELGKEGMLDDVTFKLLDRIGTKDVILIPLISRNRLQGILLADNRITGRPISEHDIHLLQSLAGQAAIAMERSRLYEAQRHRAEELEQTNRQLKESQDQLVTLEKLSIIGELTSAVAHELRNPLAIVGGFANLMLKGSVSDDQREYLTIVSNEVKHMEVVLDQVLDFSRASKVECTYFEFTGMVEQTLELAQRRLRRPDISVTVSKPDRPLRMYGNYDQLSHAIYQIFRLIADDIASGGDVVARIDHTDTTARLQLRLECAEDQHEKVRSILFKTFAQNPATHRLSLMVASETLKYHGGSYELTLDEIHPIPGVTVELPLVKE